MKKIKVFVIDTNTLISAFLLPKSTSRQTIDKAILIGIIAVSDETINEFADTFIRSKLIKPKVLITACRDPKDNKFLELAISSKAECIITGDQDLLILNPFENISIVSAATFLAINKEIYE